MLYGSDEAGDAVEDSDEQMLEIDESSPIILRGGKARWREWRAEWRGWPYRVLKVGCAYRFRAWLIWKK